MSEIARTFAAKHQENSLKWGIIVLSAFVIAVSTINIFSGYKQQCINGDPDYTKASEAGANIPLKTPTSPNAVRAARDVKKFNLMTASATFRAGLVMMWLAGSDMSAAKKITLFVFVGLLLVTQGILLLSSQSKYNDCSSKKDVTLLVSDEGWAIIGFVVVGLSWSIVAGMRLLGKGGKSVAQTALATEEMIKTVSSDASSASSLLAI